MMDSLNQSKTDMSTEKQSNGTFLKKPTFGEIFLIKKTPKFSQHNVYHKSAMFKKCCIECCTNSTVYYEPKNNNVYFVNIFKSSIYDFQKNQRRRQWCANFMPVLSANLKLVQNNFTNSILSKINEVVNHNDGTIQPEPERSEQSRLQLVKHFLDQFLLNTKPKSAILTKSALFILKFLFRILFKKIIIFQYHLSALKAAHHKRLPIMYAFNSALSNNETPGAFLADGKHDSSQSSITFLDELIFQLILFVNNFHLANVIRIVKSNYQLTDGYRNLLDYLNVKIVSSEQRDTSILNETIRAYVKECLNNEVDLSVQLNDVVWDYVCSLIENEQVHDVIVVPVSVCYEKFPDGLMKNNSGSSSTCRVLIKYLGECLSNAFRFGFGACGQVRVNLSQPFSLKEYMQKNANKRLENFLHLNLERHIKYDIFNAQSFMCTNLISFILMTYYPKGCYYDELCMKFKQVEKFLTVNYQIGFSAKSTQHAVDYSLSVLNDCIYLNKVTNPKRKNTSLMMISVKNDRSSMRKLFFMSSNVARTYFLQSVLANAIKTQLEFDFHYSGMKTNRNKLNIDENDLIQTSLQLTKIFQYEFDVYKKPCESVCSKLYETLTSLINNDILIDQTNRTNKFASSRTHLKISNSFMNNNDFYDEDYPDEEFQVPVRLYIRTTRLDQHQHDPDNREILNWKPISFPKFYRLDLETKNFKRMLCYARVLTAYIEGYFHFFSQLNNQQLFLLNKRYTENEILRSIESQLQSRHLNKEINYPQSSDGYMLKSAFRYCVNEQIMTRFGTEYILDEQSRQMLNEHCYFLKMML